MKTYSLQFGYGDPRSFTGLAPTFLIFYRLDTGATLTPPSITEESGWGIYSFQWGTTTPIAFLADAATTSPGTQGRYVVGQIDPADRSDEYGNTIVAISSTILATVGASGALSQIGTIGSTFGGQLTDPIDLFGYLKRMQELLEGDQSYLKTTGLWALSSRGSSTLLRNKIIANSASAVIRTGI